VLQPAPIGLSLTPPRAMSPAALRGSSFVACRFLSPHAPRAQRRRSQAQVVCAQYAADSSWRKAPMSDEPVRWPSPARKSTTGLGARGVSRTDEPGLRVEDAVGWEAKLSPHGAERAEEVHRVHQRQLRQQVDCVSVAR
jgi:hypothetical protein